MKGIESQSSPAPIGRVAHPTDATWFSLHVLAPELSPY
ncbi:hypothetical protein SALB1_1954 [Salinisphaera sp. LB1]|nr:hypothetical protein SALB1_1954 [Salinisphaera sp. LB1]